MTKEEIMNTLNITESEICTPAYSKEITEKLYCVAIINQGTEIAEKIFKKYIKMRDLLYGEKYEE